MLALFLLLAAFVVFLLVPDVEKFASNALIWVGEEEFFDKAETGDIALMASGTTWGRCCRAVTWSKFSHVGILVREGGELYLWEADVGQGAKEGARLIRMEDKLRERTGPRIMAWRVLNGPRPSLEEVLKVVERRKHLGFDRYMLSWWFSGVPFVGWAASKAGETFCSELAAITLKDLGIASLERPSGFSPASFEGDLKLLGGRSFGTKKFVRLKERRKGPPS